MCASSPFPKARDVVPALFHRNTEVLHTGVLALAQGTSTITESIFENRFKYLDELARMGAVIKVEGNSATIEGVEKFSGARVSAPDLRAGAALCIAGLATDGITIVSLLKISEQVDDL